MSLAKIIYVDYVEGTESNYLFTILDGRYAGKDVQVNELAAPGHWGALKLQLDPAYLTPASD